jgi:septal ring factor EnvC (AmiA/AmiB activator)
MGRRAKAGPVVGRGAWRGGALVVLLAASAGAQQRKQTPPRTPAKAPAQQEVQSRAQREELARVRAEREALERRMRDLQSSAHTLAEEVSNLDRQADATARLVGALDQQLAAIDDDVQRATGRLAHAEGELSGQQVRLRRRLVEIYKRGPLFTAEVLLSAESFGELVGRYKYLHELALRDRSLVRRVELLRDTVASQQVLLLRLQQDLARNRQEKSAEEQRLRALEQLRGRSLTSVRQQADRTRARLTQVARDEARLSNVIASLEAARRRAASRPNARPSAPSTVRPSDRARLDWPVDGSVIYRFGRVVNPNNTTTRWNGVGIAAPAGTPVKAVAAGNVVLAEPVGTYGLTVIVQHGGGDYSVYGSLSRLDVRKGAAVSRGQVVGAVGKSDPDMPAHLHFEMRPDGRAVDPLEWLRNRGR